MLQGLWRIAIGGVIAALGGCASSPSAPQQDGPQRNDLHPDRPQHTVELPVPTLTYLRTEVRTYGSDDAPYQREMAIIELRNRTPFTFEYSGQDTDWPAGSTYVWQDGTWRIVMGAVCGNGWETQIIPPGQVVALVVHGKAGRCRYEMTLTNQLLGNQVRIESAPFDAPDLLGDE